METHLAWLAGIIDGEGCLTIFRKTWKSPEGLKCVSAAADITITNSSAAMLTECRRLLDELEVKYRYILPRNSTTRPLRRITVRNYVSMLRLLDAVEPYVIAKREQVVLMREFATRAAARKGFRATDERMSFTTRMSALNKTGQLIP
jgi:hypothetical protein